MKNGILILICTLLAVSATYAQHKIDIEVENYENDTLLIGYYYGDKQLVHDTLYASNTGKFLLQGEDTLTTGMYIALTKPDNNFVQFFVPADDQEFSIKYNEQDLSDLKIKGSKDNELFLDYVKYLSGMRDKAEPLRERSEQLKKEEKPADQDIEDQISALDKEVKAKQIEVIKKNPGTMTANILKANLEIDVPEMDTVAEDKRPLAKYLYFKEHFFDNVDWKYEGLVRMPYFGDKLTTYFDRLVVQSPDSLIKEIDMVLTKLEGNEDAYRYALTSTLSKYAKMKYIGHDAIYVHMVDKYYSGGKATWSDEETIEKLAKNAGDLRPILIGKTFPNIQTYQQDGTPVKLYDVDSEYTLLLFWKHDCGHCKKAMPDIVDFYKKFKDKGLKVVTVCTSPGEKASKCWEFIEEKGMTDFLNTGDQYQRYRKKVTIRTTPKVFLLDKDKEILIKDVPGKELAKVMTDILNERNSDVK